jgi:curli production assembly/transport component CsgG
MSQARFALLAALFAVGLSGCAYTPPPAVMSKQAVFPLKTSTQTMLEALPPPEHPVAVAVYGFTDQTGQFKPETATQTLSRAVSQGGSAMLVHSLEEAGNRGWFTIVEREQLKDLLNERQIIREMRSQYLGEKTVNPEALPPLLFAGVILEGGIIGYDTNTVTGGAGASELGIGADVKYQQDTVTVSLRAVSVKTGQVLANVTTSKTISAYGVDVNVFRYVSLTSLLQTEAGFTTNEPGLVALQQAIDKAVYGLIMEGVDLKLWNFQDTNAGWSALWRYRQERDGLLSAQQVIDAQQAGHRGTPHGVELEGPPPAPGAATPRPQASGGCLDRALSGPVAQSSLDCTASFHSPTAQMAAGNTAAHPAPTATR